MTKVHRGAVSLWVGYREWRTSWSENDQLRAENERLRVQSLQVAETREENDRLPPAGSPPAPAHDHADR